jgi:hypothetical protein
VDPSSGVTRDFSKPVFYTVSGVDGSTKVYTVVVTVPAIDRPTISVSFDLGERRPTWKWSTPAGAVKFRYMLSGYDADWVETHSAAVTQYSPPTELNSGEYRFYVSAGNEEGNWSDSAVSVITIIEKIDTTGTWWGMWESADRYGPSGFFMAEIYQEDTDISGTITIPEIQMYDAALVGTVTDDSITFGDILEEIVFTGTVDAGLTAEGDYVSEPFYDSGSWSGRLVDIRNASIAESVAYSQWMDDFAFGEGDIWISDFDEILRMRIDGTVVAALPYPGDIAGPITFDGTHLWCADRWTNVVYKLDTTGTVVSSFDAPGYYTDAIAFDGECLWTTDGTTLYRLDTTGTVLSSSAFPWSPPVEGLTFDGTNLLVLGWQTEGILEVDFDGNVVAILRGTDFSLDDAACLAFDGADLWYSDYRLEMHKITVE